MEFSSESFKRSKRIAREDSICSFVLEKFFSVKLLVVEVIFSSTAEFSPDSFVFSFGCTPTKSRKIFGREDFC